MSIEAWMAAYRPNLLRAIKENPELYRLRDTLDIPAEPLAERIADKMKIGFISGGFNKNGAAIRMTVKELKIPYTYKGIAEFIAAPH